jgi:hypothetical protein
MDPRLPINFSKVWICGIHHHGKHTEPPTVPVEQVQYQLTIHRNPLVLKDKDDQLYKETTTASYFSQLATRPGRQPLRCGWNVLPHRLLRLM